MYNKKMLPLLLLPFLIITALLLLAIWNVALQSLGIIPAFGLTEPTLRYYLDVLTQPEFSAALLVSLRIALLSAVFASIFGVLLCFALIQSAKRNSPLYYLIRLPILTPHAVVAVFAVNLLSQTGLIARLCFAFGLIDDYAQFPQLLYTSSYTGAILAYLCACADGKCPLHLGGGSAKSWRICCAQLLFHHPAAVAPRYPQGFSHHLHLCLWRI